MDNKQPKRRFYVLKKGRVATDSHV